MDDYELLHRHVRGLEFGLEKVQNNTTPTVPVYDLSVETGAVWSYDGIHTVTVTFPSITGHTYALTTDQQNIFCTEQTIVASGDSTTFAITDLNFDQIIHMGFGTNYTDLQGAGFIFSVALFDRTANAFNSTKDGFTIATKTFEYGTTSAGIQYLPVTWAYDGVNHVEATFQTLNGTYDSYGIGYFDNSHNNVTSPGVFGGFQHSGGGTSAGDITGDGTIQTAYRDMGGFYNNMHRVCMLEWRRQPNDGTPSDVFSWSTISARIFLIGTSSSGVEYFPV